MTPAELATLCMSAEVAGWALGILALVLGPWLAYARRFQIRDLLCRLRKRPALGGHHVTEIDINELERRILQEQMIGRTIREPKELD